MTTLDVVVVNWNSSDQLRQCLESVNRSRLEVCRLSRVVVFDNASEDGSVERLEGLEIPLHLLRSPRNVGFGAACNRAAAAATGELILFLNPDARLYPETLEAATRFLCEHERAGICGVALEGRDGRVQRSCCRLPDVRAMLVAALGLDRLTGGRLRGSPMVEWAHDETRPVDHVIGACYLVRRSLFEQLGGFDERFFVYFEDLDFSLRARRAGWECWFLSTARAFHRGGGTTESVKARRLFYSLRSRLLYASKHFGPAGSAAVWGATLLAEPFVRLGAAAAGLAGSGVGATLGGYASLWGWALRAGRRVPPSGLGRRPADDSPGSPG